MEHCSLHCNLQDLQSHTDKHMQATQCSYLQHACTQKPVLQLLDNPIMPYELVGVVLCIRNNFVAKFQFYLAFICVA